jgi:hypothetical protein
MVMVNGHFLTLWVTFVTELMVRNVALEITLQANINHTPFLHFQVWKQGKL